MAKIGLAVLLALASLSAMAAEDLAEGEEGYMDYTITSARIGLYCYYFHFSSIISRASWENRY